MKVSIEGRVELVSIVFHLAGSTEYQAFDTPYRRAVDQYFAAFAGHPVIAATRQLRSIQGISYNAPVSIALFLNERTLLPLVDLETADELDPRWQKAPIPSYLRQLRDFATTADVTGFFAAHRSYFDAVEQRLRAVLLDRPLKAWFLGMLGPLENTVFVLVPGLLTGPWNYEATTHCADGGRTVYQIISLENPDADGLPTPTVKTTQMVGHEMAHAWVKPVVENHDAELSVVEPLYQRLRGLPGQRAYGSRRIFVEELLVRALTVLLVRERVGVESALALARADSVLGFDGDLALVDWLDKQPQRPLNLSALMPDLLKQLSAPGDPTHSP